MNAVLIFFLIVLFFAGLSLAYNIVNRIVGYVEDEVNNSKFRE